MWRVPALQEHANDYLNWFLQHEEVPWSVNSDIYRKVANTHLDKPAYQDDVQHLSSIHILAQKHKFDEWLESKNSVVAANCLEGGIRGVVIIIRNHLMR